MSYEHTFAAVPVNGDAVGCGQEILKWIDTQRARGTQGGVDWSAIELVTIAHCDDHLLAFVRAPRV